MQPPAGPPVWTALNGRPSTMPPPMPYTMSRSDVPIGTSTRPVLTTRPASAKTFVPLLFSVPMPANHAAPLRMIGATFAKVSTLLISVGRPRRPDTAGYGGRGRGVPRPPSIDAISAVSSPHTNAPAPSRTSTSNENWVSMHGRAEVAVLRRPRGSPCAAGQRRAGTPRGSRRSRSSPRRRRRRSPCPRAPGAGRSRGRDRSMNAPGSPSSALQITTLGEPGALATVFHLRPVG